MPAIENAQTAAVTNAEYDNATLNPDRDWDQNVVHITLIGDGITINPDNIYDMVDAQFGTVRSDKTSSRGTYILTVST